MQKPIIPWCKICLSYLIDHFMKDYKKCPSCGYTAKLENVMKISMDEILMGRAKFEDLPQELQKNGEILLERLNKFRDLYGKPMYVNSGYRTEEDNNKCKGAKNSPHLHLQACDFKDNDNELKQFIENNPDILETCDLYMEDPKWTTTWLHLDIRPRKNRTFIP